MAGLFLLELKMSATIPGFWFGRFEGLFISTNQKLQGSSVGM